MTNWIIALLMLCGLAGWCWLVYRQSLAKGHATRKDAERQRRRRFPKEIETPAPQPVRQRHEFGRRGVVGT